MQDKNRSIVTEWKSGACNLRLRACMLSCYSHVRLFVTQWTVTCQLPLSIGFSRQGHWSRLPCPTLEDLSNPGMELTPLMLPALGGRFFTTSATWEAQFKVRTFESRLQNLTNTKLKIWKYIAFKYFVDN